MRCFNPRTPCGVRPTQVQPLPPGGWFQSTHSLRSATVQVSVSFSFYFVSIHALLAECDLKKRYALWTVRRFQSTHSLRSATLRPGGGLRVKKVSIHALLAECDPYSYASFGACSKFQSTHSLRSATKGKVFELFNQPVSIHALLAECDPCMTRKRGVIICFNPRTPCGVRLVRRATPPHT